MKSLTTRLLLFLSMPLLLLCACHTTCPVGPQGSSELPSESALQPLALPEDAHVLAFDREHILFCRQENASDESAHGLYRYDVAGGETVRLWGYPAPAYSGDAAVLRGQDLYLLTEGAVCQVDVSSCAATEIAEVPTEAMVSLHAMDNGLVLHSILSEENGGLTYAISHRQGADNSAAHRIGELCGSTDRQLHHIFAAQVQGDLGRDGRRIGHICQQLDLRAVRRRVQGGLQGAVISGLTVRRHRGHHRQPADGTLIILHSGVGALFVAVFAEAVFIAVARAGDDF